VGDDEQGDEEVVQDAGGGPGRDRAVVHRPPWRHAIQDEATEKIVKLDSNAMYIDSDLKVSSPCLLR
jgi:hypothetical protein